MSEFPVFVHQVGDTDDILEFVSHEFGNVMLSKDGWAKQQVGRHGDWRVVTISEASHAQEGGLLEVVVRAIRGSVAALLGIICWQDNRIDDLRSGKVVTVRAEDAVARLNEVRARYYQEGPVPYEWNAQGIRFVSGTSSGDVYIRDTHEVLILSDETPSLKPVNLPDAFVSVIYNATSHLIMGWARRNQIMEELDPSLR